MTEFMARDVHEPPLVPVQVRLAVAPIDAQVLMHFFVEVSRRETSAWHVPPYNATRW